MKIQNYQINLRNSFKLTSTFFDLYNERQTNVSLKIKATADKLAIYLLKQCVFQHSQDKQTFADTPQHLIIDTSKPYILYTNTVRLANHMRVSENTIRNSINRLMAAGFIVGKTLHGRYKNYELNINSAFLFISDVENPDNCNHSPEFVTSVKNAFQKHKAQILHQYVLVQEPFNNILINISSVDNAVLKTAKNNIALGTISVNNELKAQEQLERPDLYKNAPQLVKSEKSEVATKDNQKRKKVPPKKEKANYIEHLKMMYAKYIVLYAMYLFWDKKEVYEAEKERTINYVYNYYFANVYSEKDLEKYVAIYKWRLDAAKRYAKRKDYTIQVYPYKYFDVNNKTSGFASTHKWFLEHLKYSQNKKTKNKYLTDVNKLNKALIIYAKSPTLANYRKQEEYIKSNIPHLLDNFLLHFNQFNNQQIS